MQNVPGGKTFNGIKMVRLTRDAFLCYEKSVNFSKLKQQQHSYKERQLKHMTENCLSKDFMNLTEFEKSPVLPHTSCLTVSNFKENTKE